MLKKKIFILGLLCLSLFSLAQTGDAELDKRLNEYLQINKELRFEAIMDYIHPVLFTIVPKANILEVFKKSFDNEEMNIGIDSILISSISAEFKVKEAVYRKVDYRMRLNIRMKDSSSLKEPEFIKIMTGALEAGFPGSTVKFHEPEGLFDINTPTMMFAIRDKPGSPWMFLGFQKNETLIKAIYPEEVISHFKLL